VRLRGWVALTGTPGVGKSAVANDLRLRGVSNVNLGAFAQDKDLTDGFDEARMSAIVDPARVAEGLSGVTQSDGLLLLDGHWSHDVPGVGAAIVLRLRPDTLRTRLERRGWGDSKVRENVEAEAMDLILQEAVARLGVRRVHEVDTTGRTIRGVANAVLAVCRGTAPSRAHRPGQVDWSAFL
jgi:adenylate kinase